MWLWRRQSEEGGETWLGARDACASENCVHAARRRRHWIGIPGHSLLPDADWLEVFPSVATTPMLDAGQWTSLRCFFHNQRLSFSLDLRKIKMDQVHMSDLFMDQGDRDDQEDWGG